MLRHLRACINVLNAETKDAIRLTFNQSYAKSIFCILDRKDSHCSKCSRVSLIYVRHPPIYLALFRFLYGMV